MSRNGLFAVVAFLLSLLLYGLTSVPSVYWEDSAAFQLAVAELGIPHNPSFPFYLLVNKVISLLPLGETALMVNLGSALFAALSVMLLYLLAAGIATRLRPHATIARPAALLAALIFASAQAVWLQAVRAEVYALNLFLTLLLLWTALSYQRGLINSLRFAALFGLVAGLGFANHYLLLAAVAAPLLAVVVAKSPSSLLRPREIGAGLAFLCLGLSAYLYLPLREAFNPMLNWGDFSSVGASLRSILRLDEQLPVAAAAPAFLPNLAAVVGYVLRGIGALLLLISTVGLVELLRRDRFVALLALLPTTAVVLVASWAAEFSPYNLDLLGYLVPVFALPAILAPLGLAAIQDQLQEFLRRGFPRMRLVMVLLLAAIPAYLLADQVVGNYAQTSKRGFDATERYADVLLRALPPESIFLAGEDNSFLPLLYHQAVAGVRTDVVLLSGGALLRSDYRRKTQARYPDLWYPDDWLRRSYAEDFADRLGEWCHRNSQERPVCMTLSEWTASLIGQLEPVAFAYRLVGDEGVSNSAISVSHQFYRDHSSIWESSNDLTTREHFGRHLYNHAVYLYRHGVDVGVAEYAAWAAATDSENPMLLFNCANLLYAAGFRNKADAVVAAIRRLDPDFQMPIQSEVGYRE